ncbi:MAG: Permease of the drug/metabolite transporter (DMT) superfamily [uncultured Paraburkholderia sp.]|nr:MAG: Permease of the drug/metabolite transporter (DMT) superfamily [uncultured Paraburkholderia sp.]
MFSFLTPLFGVTFGVLLLGESFSVRFLMAAALVLTGIALGQCAGQARGNRLAGRRVVRFRNEARFCSVRFAAWRCARRVLERCGGLTAPTALSAHKLTSSQAHQLTRPPACSALRP